MTGRYLNPVERAGIRFLRAEFGFIRADIIAAIFGRTRQQVSNIAAGIIVGGTASAQDAALRRLFEADHGGPLTDKMWKGVRQLAEAEALLRLKAALPDPEPYPELDRMMDELTASLKL